MAEKEEQAQMEVGGMMRVAHLEVVTATFPFTGCYVFDFTTLKYTVTSLGGGNYTVKVQLLINNQQAAAPITLSGNQQTYNGPPASVGNTTVSTWNLMYQQGGSQSAALTLTSLVETRPGFSGSVSNVLMASWDSSNTQYSKCTG